MRSILAALLLVLLSAPAVAQDSRILAFQFGLHSDSAKPLHRSAARQAYTHARKRQAAVRASKSQRVRAPKSIESAPVAEKQSPFPKQFHERVFDVIAKPSRYISGRLICAVNVGVALAERGIQGTGSALAKSYLSWGRPSGPVPGAVAFNWRRGGGHVAIVAKVEGGKVWIWNPSPRGRGWQLRVNHYASIYRAPS